MSTVIKAGQTGAVRQRFTPVDLVDHLGEARAVIEEARRRNREILQNAEREAEEIRVRVEGESRRAGYEAGYARGLAEGTEAGRKAAYDEAVARFDSRYGSAATAMMQAVREIESRREELRIAAERDLLELAVAIARKLTFEIGKLHREAAAENLRRAIRLVGCKTDLNVSVHPDDLEVVREAADALLREVGASTSISIGTAESVSPGGCVVKNDRTVADFTLETLIDEVVRQLLSDGSEIHG